MQLLFVYANRMSNIECKTAKCKSYFLIPCQCDIHIPVSFYGRVNFPPLIEIVTLEEKPQATLKASRILIFRSPDHKSFPIKFYCNHFLCCGSRHYENLHYLGQFAIRCAIISFTKFQIAQNAINCMTSLEREL